MPKFYMIFAQKIFCEFWGHAPPSALRLLWSQGAIMAVSYIVYGN